MQRWGRDIDGFVGENGGRDADGRPAQGGGVDVDHGGVASLGVVDVQIWLEQS